MSIKQQQNWRSERAREKINYDFIYFDVRFNGRGEARKRMLDKKTHQFSKHFSLTYIRLAKRINSIATHFVLCAKFPFPFVFHIFCKFMCKNLRINACECENLMKKRSNKTIICKWKAFNQSYQSIAGWLNTIMWVQIIR